MSRLFVGASRKRPCPVCGRRKWPCYFRPDGSFAACKTVYSEGTDRQGLYLNVIGDGKPRPAPIAPTRRRVTLAPADRLDAVYSSLLSRLTLKSEHFDNLRARGLSDERIEANGYRSTPAKEQCDELAARLANSYNLEGVPGFFFRSGAWRLR